MIHFMLLVSRQGKVRLSKFYSQYTGKERTKIMKQLAPLILSWPARLCNFIEYQDLRVAYKRYASLYFVVGIDANDNELHALDMIHHYVEVLDRYFGNVCELDLIFNFHRAYFVLDEVLVAGGLQETSKKHSTSFFLSFFVLCLSPRDMPLNMRYLRGIYRMCVAHSE